MTEIFNRFKKVFYNRIKSNFKDVGFNGNSSDLDKSSYTILSTRFPTANDMLLFTLDLNGIAVSGGSACQSGSSKGSHVLDEILQKQQLMIFLLGFPLVKTQPKKK